MVSLESVVARATQKGLDLSSVNFIDVEICCDCSEVLFIDDEAYEHKNGKTLCTKCSFLCGCCEKYVKESEHDTKRNMCSECKSIEEEWGGARGGFDV